MRTHFLNQYYFYLDYNIQYSTSRSFHKTKPDICTYSTNNHILLNQIENLILKLLGTIPSWTIFLFVSPDPDTICIWFYLFSASLNITN